MNCFPHVTLCWGIPRSVCLLVKEKEKCLQQVDLGLLLLLLLMVQLLDLCEFFVLLLIHLCSLYRFSDVLHTSNRMIEKYFLNLFKCVAAGPCSGKVDVLEF